MKPMLYELERRVAMTAAELAGAKAASMQGHCQVSTKPDASLVTDADHAADRVIRETLAASFPSDALLSEESTDDGLRRLAERVWIIDPIDGTKGFVEGSDEWAIHIALLVSGELVLGVVAAPASQRIMSAIPHHGLWDKRHGVERALPIDVLVHLPERQRSTLIISHRQHEDPHHALSAFVGYDQISSHSVGIKVMHLIDGNGQVYVHPKPLSDWDAAAPMALALAAGGSCTSATGAPLVLNGRDAQVPSFLVTHAAQHAQVVAALAEAGYEDESP